MKESFEGFTADRLIVHDEGCVSSYAFCPTPRANAIISIFALFWEPFSLSPRLPLVFCVCPADFEVSSLNSIVINLQ
ncbi:hypothetical protein I7I48_06162 [Histoplasma ohiense]|nr:hypothetical protein I7I48_06162 [Histoplasma ohiense (nom. inval.)]